MDKEFRPIFKSRWISLDLEAKHLDHLFFLIIGNFITSCYSKNFTAFNLLRRQLEFPLVKQNQFLITKIPKGINWNDCFIFAGDQFVSKVKDVAVTKGVKKADEENDLFYFDVSFLEQALTFENKMEISQGALVYSPWFRFIKEPFDFLDQEIKGDYIVKALLYVARLNKIDAFVEKREDSVDSLIFKNTFKGASRLDIVFKQSLESIALVSEKGSSIIDFNKYKICLFVDHNRGLFEALTRSKEGVFKNLEVNKNDQIIELARAND